MNEYNKKTLNTKAIILQEEINQLRKTHNHNTLYLSEIIEKEKPEFKNNNLILAPHGRGKTTLIKNLMNNEIGKVLIIVSNTTKDLVNLNEKYEKLHIMTYPEFGKRIEFSDEFIKDIKQIFCDEIHSLIAYQHISDSTALSHAIKTLFAKHEGKEIFYFTATDEYLKILEKKSPRIMKNINILDYRKHPDIKQYIPLSEYPFNHIEQIRPHLRARLRTFNYFNYKSLAFSRTITSQKMIAKIAEEEGFKPLVIWSINNNEKENKMTDEQIEARNYLLNNGEIPEPYNFLIINSSMQEGWDLFDDKIKLAIMNTTSETEKIQALGRLRHDIDILTYKVRTRQVSHANIEIPIEYLNVPLTTAKKEELCKNLNIINAEGIMSTWRSIKPLINNDSSGYEVVDHIKTMNGKRSRVTTITMKKDIE